MTSERRVDRIAAQPLRAIDHLLQSTSLTAGEKRSVERDRHLIEGALASDRMIASLETECRGHFARAALEECDPIKWIDPSISVKFAVEWIKAGATAKTKSFADTGVGTLKQIGLELATRGRRRTPGSGR